MRASIRLLVLIAVFFGVPSSCPGQFVDASEPPLDDSLASDGCSWGDVDGDGDQDLFIGNKTANRLLRNDGLSFVDVATAAMQDTLTHARGVPFGDYDNDGDPDLYICNKQVNRFFRNDGGTFQDATVPPLNDAASTRSAAWADFDGDGDLDLYVANENAANRMLRNDAGAFVDVAVGPVADPAVTSSIVWGDTDGDGDPDLYLCNSGSANRLLRNDGLGAFTDVTSGPLGNAGNGRGADMADYDNDGDLDLYFSNSNQPNKLLRNDGGGVWADATAVPLGDPGEGTGVAWADYDNDGDLDLYLVNWTTANVLFRNDGVSFADVTTPLLGDAGPGKGTAWCDYDGDGDVDLYLANSGLANRMFRNDTSGNRWLHVELEGTVSNRSAIGARVTVVTPGRRQIREVSGGFGVGSQGSLALEFGLGAATAADSVIIGWPSGTPQVLIAVPADQRIQVIEPHPTGVADPRGNVRSGLALSVTPNPFGGVTTVRYALTHSGTVDLVVLDVRGRRILQLQAGPRPAGQHTVTWDGRDRRGMPVPAGVYFCKLTARGESHVRKIVRSR